MFTSKQFRFKSELVLSLAFLASTSNLAHGLEFVQCPTVSIPDTPTIVQQVEVLKNISLWAIALRDKAPALSPAEETWLDGEIGAGGDRAARAAVSKEFSYRLVRQEATHLLKVSVTTMEIVGATNRPKLAAVSWWDLMRLIQSNKLREAVGIFEIQSQSDGSSAAEYDAILQKFQWSCEALAFQIGDKIIAPRLMEGIDAESEVAARDAKKSRKTAVP